MNCKWAFTKHVKAFNWWAIVYLSERVLIGTLDEYWQRHLKDKCCRFNRTELSVLACLVISVGQYFNIHPSLHACPLEVTNVPVQQLTTSTGRIQQLFVQREAAPTALNFTWTTEEPIESSDSSAGSLPNSTNGPFRVWSVIPNINKGQKLQFKLQHL